MPSPNRLPIHDIEPEILSALGTGNRLVLVAPTGSGKTTQVPQMLLDAGLAGEKRIVVLQPRRVAARTVARRVASERSSPLGGEVGYQVRFEDHTSLGTRICFVTEGILLRWMQDNPDLPNIGVILFDEFHERNLLSDVALALARKLQRTTRPDLKLIVMSATLEAEPVAAYLDHCPILVSAGQSYGVEIRFLDLPDDRPLPEQAAQAVEEVIREGEQGDILVFMPGMGEINATLNAIRARRPSEALALIPLHGDLPPNEQDRAFQPCSQRKVVVATNVAETSITIDGIRHVIDSGCARISRYDVERGIGTLFLEPISRASADQRKGRAGRTAPGTCRRLWTESNHLNRPEANTPEIQRTDLAEVVLLLHSLNIRKAAEFGWLDQPDPAAINRAENLLQMLGALLPSPDPPEPQPGSPPRSDLTVIGRQMLKLPMHPRYSRMLVEAARLNCVPQAALCAALVSGRDLLMRLRQEDKQAAQIREDLFESNQESDFFTLIRSYEFAIENRFDLDRCRRHGIHAQTARMVAQTHEQILHAARGLHQTRSDARPERPPEEALRRCLMAGFIDQLCLRRDTGTLECFLTEGRTGTLVRESVVRDAPLFVAASIREVSSRGTAQLTLLGLATAVEPGWIEELFPQHITDQVEHVYDRTHKRVSAIRIRRFRDLILGRTHQRETDPEASGEALARAHLEGEFELPLLNHECRQFIGRVNLAAAALPELEIPPFSREDVARCLSRAFSGLTLAKEAQATPLRTAFQRHLPRDQVSWIDELAPASVPWPTGRNARLLYHEEALDNQGNIQPPELQANLLECFQLTGHPAVCEGKVAVTLWLCAPSGKRIESTPDWPAFKRKHYPRLKATLQKKFPGVAWP